MKVLLFVLMFSVPSFAKDCIPKGTSFTEVMRAKDFKTTNTENFIKEFTKSIEAMAKYRKQNCDIGPDRIKENCRSSCALLSYKNYRGTCNRFCEIQRLKLVENQLSECNDKLKAIVQIEKDIRARDKASGNR